MVADARARLTGRCPLTRHGSQRCSVGALIAVIEYNVHPFCHDGVTSFGHKSLPRKNGGRLNLKQCILRYIYLSE